MNFFQSQAVKDAASVFFFEAALFNLDNNRFIWLPALNNLQWKEWFVVVRSDQVYQPLNAQRDQIIGRSKKGAKYVRPPPPPDLISFIFMQFLRKFGSLSKLGG